MFNLEKNYIRVDYRVNIKVFQSYFIERVLQEFGFFYPSTFGFFRYSMFNNCFHSSVFFSFYQPNGSNLIPILYFYKKILYIFLTLYFLYVFEGNNFIENTKPFGK